jgi:hypothetical protein
MKDLIKKYHAQGYVNMALPATWVEGDIIGLSKDTLVGGMVSSHTLYIQYNVVMREERE